MYFINSKTFANSQASLAGTHWCVQITTKANDYKVKDSPLPNTFCSFASSCSFALIYGNPTHVAS
jgi:hypothetical protein